MIDSEKIEIDKRTLLLTDPPFFVKRVIERAGGEMSYKAAYYLIEAEYISVFNKSRYSSYESFRVIKSRVLKSENRLQLKLF